MRPVRFPPCAAGASPMSTSRAAGSPNPGTGRAQYVQVSNRRTFVRATSSRHRTRRGQARHSTMRACRSRSARGPPCAPTTRNVRERTGDAAGSAAARSATAAATLAAARHLLHRTARTKPALGLLARMRLVRERAAEPAAALGRTAVLRLVHHQRAAAEVLAVQIRDRLLHLFGVLQVDEREPARAPRLAIGDDLD